MKKLSALIKKFSTLNPFDKLRVDAERSRSINSQFSIPKSFVLIELIIVTAIIGIISAIGTGTFVSYSRTQKLQTATNDLATILNVAKSNSFSQIKDNALCTSSQPLEGYKVVISCSTYDLYVVCAGAPDQKIMKTKSLPENVMLGKILPMSVFFPILKSQVSPSGSIPLTAFGQTRCLQVDSKGVISQPASCPAPVVCPTPTPTPLPTPTPTLTPTPTPTPTLTPTPTPTPIPSSPLYRRIFVTSILYNGNLGGLSGADAKCQTRASAVSLGGTWKAWLSSSVTSAASRFFQPAVPYKLLNNIVVASSWIDLTDGVLVNPINWTETGVLGTSSVWTNTTISGGIATTANTCSDWSSGSSAFSGRAGNSANVSSLWTNSLNNGCNGATSRLYCFEEIAPTPTPPSGFSPDTGGTLATGLVSYWKLNETSGTSAADSKGTNNGTLTAGPTWVAGKLGNAVNFDKVDDYIDTGITNVNYSGITFSSWIKLDSLTGAQSIIDKQTNPTRGIELMFHGSINVVQFEVNTANGNVAGNFTGTWATNTWYHIVATYDGANVRVYRDGVLGATVGSQSGTIVANAAVNLKIGVSNWNALAQFFGGSIDEVGIWSRALTATEISDLYNGGAGNSYTP